VDEVEIVDDAQKRVEIGRGRDTHAPSGGVRLDDDGVRERRDGLGDDRLVDDGFDTSVVRGVGIPAASSAASTPALFREVRTASRSFTHGTDSRASTTTPSISREG